MATADGAGQSNNNLTLRVLSVEGSLRDNGGLRISLDYARRWRELGARTHVCAVQDVDDGTLADPSQPVEFLTPRNSRFRYSWPLALGRLVRRARCSDVVVSGSEIGTNVLLAYIAARLARRPFAVLVQADLEDAIEAWVPRPVRWLTRWIHRHADLAMCVADSILPGVIANGLAPERARVVVNGVDVERIRGLAGLTSGTAASSQVLADRRRTPPTVVACGRLSDQKDFPLLVRAHADVLGQGLLHRLVIIGEGPARPALEALVEELGVASTVRLAGHLDNPHAEIATADLFVLSSRTEGSPLALLEALSIGIPVISTRCGSAPQSVLEDGLYGDLVPVGSQTAMADAVARHLRDPSRLHRLAAAAPQRARAFDAGRSARLALTLVAGLRR